MERKRFGLYYGVVQKEPDPKKFDRLRVKLHRDGRVTAWASVVRPTSWYVLPDPGDTVVVAFIGGDPEQPIILGGVWNDPKPPPEVNKDGKNQHRGYRSRTGHRLVFEDSDKAKLVLIDMKGKNVVGLGEFATGGSGPNACEVFAPPMASGSGVSLSAMQGSIEISCDGKLSITAENIKISAKKSHELSGKAMSLTGDSKVKLSSNLLDFDPQLMLV